MGFFFFLLYLGVTYMFPAELFPELVPYRITLWLGIVSLAASILALAPAAKLTVWALPNGLVLGLVLSMMISVMWADSWMGAPMMVLQVFGPALTLFLLAVWNLNSMRRLHIAAATLVFLAVTVAAQGVAAYHFGFLGDKLLMSQNTDDDGDAGAESDGTIRVRGLGQMNDPNDLAMVLVASLPFLGLAWRKGRLARNILLLGPPGALIIYATFLTRSRGGLLAMLAVLATGLASAGRLKALLAVGAMAVIFMAANFAGGREMSSSEESAAGRIDAWSEGLDMFRANPVLGVGYRNFTEHHDLTAHNSFVLCFAELGTVGYFFWLALLMVALLQLKQVRHHARERDSLDGDRLSRYAKVVMVSFTGLLVAAFFLSRSYNPILFLLTGLALAVYKVASAEGYPVGLPSLPQIGQRVVALEFASIIAIYLFVRINRLFV